MNKGNKQSIRDEMIAILHEADIAASWLWAVHDERANRHLRECLKFIREAAQRTVAVMRASAKPRASSQHQERRDQRPLQQQRPPQDIRRVK
ncbi:MAG: hypothetical protein FJZ89_13515 [Chloroflexi bacterium]|nr:hypothetical protein [Chloroflexota bacterium]